MLLLIILGVSLGIGVSGSVLITRSIVGPLKDAIHVAEVVASGDLTGSIETNFADEPGQLLQALHKMSERLCARIAVCWHI